MALSTLTMHKTKCVANFPDKGSPSSNISLFKTMVDNFRLWVLILPFIYVKIDTVGEYTAGDVSAL
jgi:hypothetical protein